MAYVKPKLTLMEARAARFILEHQDEGRYEEMAGEQRAAALRALKKLNDAISRYHIDKAKWEEKKRKPEA